MTNRGGIASGSKSCASFQRTESDARARGCLLRSSASFSLPWTRGNLSRAQADGSRRASATHVISYATKDGHHPGTQLVFICLLWAWHCTSHTVATHFICLAAGILETTGDYLKPFDFAGADLLDPPQQEVYPVAQCQCIHLYAICWLSPADRASLKLYVGSSCCSSRQFLCADQRRVPGTLLCSAGNFSFSTESVSR